MGPSDGVSLRLSHFNPSFPSRAFVLTFLVSYLSGAESHGLISEQVCLFSVPVSPQPHLSPPILPVADALRHGRFLSGRCDGGRPGRLEVGESRLSKATSPLTVPLPWIFEDTSFHFNSRSLPACFFSWCPPEETQEEQPWAFRDRRSRGSHRTPFREAPPGFQARTVSGQLKASLSRTDQVSPSMA